MRVRNARNSEFPSSGTIVFTGKSPIMDQTIKQGQVIDYYYAGESVSYDQVLEKDGYKWPGYLSYSGSRRYVQYAELSNTEKGWKKKGRGVGNTERMVS